MTILKDLLDVVKDLGQAGSDTADTLLKKKRYSSISKRSLEGTLQFPVIASRSLDVETLQMVSKALERDYASFVQIAMTMSPAFNIKSDKDLATYLRNFHQNSNVKTGISDLHNTLVTVGENYTMAEDKDKNVQFLYATVSEANCGPINRDNMLNLASLLEGINEESLNQKFVPKRSRLLMSGNDSLDHYYNVQEAGTIGRATLKPPTGMNAYGPQTPDHIKKRMEMAQKQQEDRDREDEKTRKRTMDELRIKGLQNQLAAPRMNGGQSVDFSLPNQVLKDNDARKANELVPTIMHMRVQAVNNDGELQKTVDFLLGIKTTLHPVSSEEMVNNIYSGLRNKGKFFNFIRFTTGEIGFFKDFLLNIKDVRADVSQQSAGSSKWWMALKRRRNLAKIGDRLMLPKKFLPNATIVLSYDEAEYIKSTMGFDLMDTAVVDRLMKEYFLLGFVVVDSSSQIIHFMFDGQMDYQSVSFGGLEKSTHGKNDMDFKDVLRLVQRV